MQQQATTTEQPSPASNIWDASQVWRFELRLGAKQLRIRFEIRSWQDVRDIIGDSFTDSLGRIRYRIPPQTPTAPAGPPTEPGDSLRVSLTATFSLIVLASFQAT